MSASPDANALRLSLQTNTFPNASTESSNSKAGHFHPKLETSSRHSSRSYPRLFAEGISETGRAPERAALAGDLRVVAEVSGEVVGRRTAGAVHLPARQEHRSSRGRAGRRRRVRPRSERNVEFLVSFT